MSLAEPIDTGAFAEAFADFYLASQAEEAFTQTTPALFFNPAQIAALLRERGVVPQTFALTTKTATETATVTVTASIEPLDDGKLSLLRRAVLEPGQAGSQ